jgi:hypothetical protein
MTISINYNPRTSGKVHLQKPRRQQTNDNRRYGRGRDPRVTNMAEGFAGARHDAERAIVSLVVVSNSGPSGQSNRTL